MKQGIFLKLTACLLVYPNLVYTTIVLAEAPRQAGVVTMLTGEATLTRATRSDQPLALKFRDEVLYKDRIRTKANSVARVLLGGKAVVTVRALSDLIITEEPQRPAVVNLSSGKIALDVARSRMKPGEAIEVHTPNAFAALRGTMIVVEVLPASGKTGTPAVDDGGITYEPLRTASTEPALPVLVPNVITNFYVLEGSIDVTSLARPGAPPVTLGAGLSLSAIGPSLRQPRPNPPPSQLLTDLKATPQHAGTPDEAKKSVSEKHHKTATALAEAIAPKKHADKAKEEKSKDDKGKEDKAKEEKAKEDKDKEEKVIISPPPPPPPPPSPTTNVILPTTGTTTQTTQLVIPPDQAINTPQTFSTISLSAPGTLSGDATVTATGLLTWTGGTMAGAGITQAQGRMAITGNVTLNRTLNNAGLGDIQGDFMIAGTGTLNNSNTLTKSIGSGRATIATSFNSSGVVDVQSGTLVLSGTVTNNGMLKAESGTTLTVSSSLTNLSGGTLTGGTYNVLGTMQLPGNITTNVATIILDGTSSQFLNSGTGTDTLANFTTNASTGSFTIQHGRNFTTAGTLTNSGTVTVGSSSKLTIGGGGNYFQTGGSTTINGAITLPGGGGYNISGGTVTSLAPLETPGANLTLTGSFFTQSAGTVTSSADALSVGTFTLTGSASPVFSLTGGTLTLTGEGSDLVSLAGGTLTLNGALMTLSLGAPTVMIGGDVLSIASTVTGPTDGTPLINVAAGSLNVSGNVVNLTDVTSTLNLAGPILKVTGGAATVGTGLKLASGASLVPTDPAPNGVATVAVGNSPFGVALTPDGTRAYVANQTSNSVSVISTATNAVVATVGVGLNPFGVALTPDGARAYVTNEVSNTVSVINSATNTVTATVPVGTLPAGVAFTPDGARAYVTNFIDNTVSVINTATNTVIGSPIPVGVHPSLVAFTPDGARAYVTNSGDNTVSVINTATNTVIGSPIPVGVNPFGVAVTPDGARAYVTNQNSNTVSVINTATNTVVATVLVGTVPALVALTPDGTRAYVANEVSNTVSVINTATNMVVATVTVGTLPAGVAFTPDGARAYVTNFTSSAVSVIGGVTSPLFQVTGGTLTVNGNLISIPASTTLTMQHPVLDVINGGSVTANADVVSVSGTVTTGNAPLIKLNGRGSATGSQTVEGNTLLLGTDQPIHGPGTCPPCPLGSSLLTASGATGTTNQAVVLDTALLEATAPLIKLMNNTTMTSNSDLINLVRNAKMNVNLLPGDALVKLNASTLTVNNGSLFNMAGGSSLSVNGSLFSLTNTSTLNINSGWLVNVSGGSVFTLTGGSLGLFGTGTNTLNITNTAALCSGCTLTTSITNLVGVPVLLANGASASNVIVNSGFTPFAGLSASNKVNVSGTSGAVLALSGATSKVKLGF